MPLSSIFQIADNRLPTQFGILGGSYGKIIWDDEALMNFWVSSESLTFENVDIEAGL